MFKREIGIILTCFALILLHFGARSAFAQAPLWNEPVNISNSTTESRFPSIAVDPAGVVHVVWCEEEGESGCTAIYYTRYDGATWTMPIDIIIPPEKGQTIDSFVLTADQAGALHLVWGGGSGDQIFYSQAYAPEAGSARSWRTPIPIGDPMPKTTAPDLAVDRAGILHLVYTVQRGPQSGVYYTQSADNGQSWREPTQVFANLDSERMVDRARLTVDRSGGIHVSWTEYSFPENFPPLGIRYAHSEDNGQTWTWPLLIDGPYDLSGLIAVGEEQIHLVWSGTNPDRYKFHRWSADRGATWSQIFHTSEVGGFQGWPGLATDSLKQVHLLQAWGSGHEVLGHRVWRDNGWSPITRLIETPVNLPRDVLGTTASPEYPDVAVGLGNELHVVAMQWVEHTPDQWTFDIFYIGGLADVPKLEPQALPLPTLIPSPTPPARPTKNIKITSSPVRPTASAVASFGEPTPETNSDPTITILLGALPAFISLVGVIVVRLLRRQL